MDFSAMQSGADKAIKLLKAVSNQNRLMILCCLQDKEMSVTELNQILTIPQSSLSQQLAALRNEGLVKTRREAQSIYYSLDSQEVVQLIHLLHAMYCE